MVSLLLRSWSHKRSTDGTLLDPATVIPEVTSHTSAPSRRKGASGSHPAIY